MGARLLAGAARSLGGALSWLSLYLSAPTYFRVRDYLTVTPPDAR
jgi:hypothetical protein